MKRLCLNKSQVKRGVASFYLVIFATILFGVVTLSFMRIILSEAGQSTNDDLSRSAYDSAIAGVEDAKTAVNRYYTCISSGGTESSCKRDLLFGDTYKNCDNGIGVAKYLYGESYNITNGDDNKLSANEVMIQETNAGTSSTNNNSDQAYTCVIVSDVVPDYRGTLSSDTPTKVVPLGIYDGASSSNTKITTARTARFSWYSQLNEGNVSFKTNSDAKLPPKGDDSTIPPTMVVTLLHAKSGMTLSNFYTANNSAKITYSTFVFVPSATNAVSGVPYKITSQSIRDAGQAGKEGLNAPIGVTCSTASEFACIVDFDISGLSIAADDSLFLIVSLPYGDTKSDFSAALYSSDNPSEENRIDLTGVQIQVDSTGRTNQLIRRVETRLDPADLFFPYPQYELELDGDPNNTVNKDFWITANCWYTHPNSNNGEARTCNNNGRISGD